jgi:hypothetical protein
MLNIAATSALPAAAGSDLRSRISTRAKNHIPTASDRPIAIHNERVVSLAFA